MEFDFTLGMLPLLTKVMKTGNANDTAKFFLENGSKLNKEELYLLCKELILGIKVHTDMSGYSEIFEDVAVEIDDEIYGGDR